MIVTFKFTVLCNNIYNKYLNILQTKQFFLQIKKFIHYTLTIVTIWQKNNFPVKVTFDGNDDGKSSIVLNLVFLVTLFTVGLFICSLPHSS